MTRKALPVAIAAAALLLTPMPATAHPNYHYSGECDIVATRLSGDAGSQTAHDGVISAAVAVVDAAGLPAPLVPVTVECGIVVDGAYPPIVVHSASGPGAAVAPAQQVTYYARPVATTELCTIVTIAAEQHMDCAVFGPIRVLSDTPANGTITISNPGTGTTTTKTYDDVAWNCYDVSGPDYVGMECAPVNTGISWVCAWVTVDATGAGTAGVSGIAGGRATCNNGGVLDTGLSTNSQPTAAAGALGPVVAFRCVAYGQAGSRPRAPYKVTCAEPAAPGT